MRKHAGTDDTQHRTMRTVPRSVSPVAYITMYIPYHSSCLQTYAVGIIAWWYSREPLLVLKTPVYVVIVATLVVVWSYGAVPRYTGRDFSLPVLSDVVPGSARALLLN